MPYLVAFGALKRDVYELGEEVVVVGRERKATFSLSDFQVSRRHAEITFKDGTYHVRDLNSRNGFFHNQKHVRSGEGIDLDHGDELVLGRTGIRYYRRDPGNVDDLTAPVIPESLKNIPNTRPEEGEAKGNEASARKNSARAAKKKARSSNAEQDVVTDDDFGVETDDAANISDAPPAKKKGGGLDSEVLKYAAGSRPKTADDATEEESKSKRNRYTELSEDVGETKASARGKKASARQKAAPQSARVDSAGAEKRGDSRRRKKSTGRVPVQKGQSGREKAGSGREKAKSGRSSAKHAVAAEVQSLRTLLDRTEKERRFYRHLTVGMVVFLMLLMSLLFIKLMSSDTKDEADTKDEVQNSSTKSPSRRPTALVLNLPKNGLENAKRLDRDVFTNAILPILKTKCAVCHGPSNSKSKFRFDPDNERQALAMAASYVLPGRPDRSFLLQKPLPKSEGGEIHKGGAVFKTDSEDFRAMHGWINDVKTPGQDNEPMPDTSNSELAPIAKISRVKTEVAVGERVVLDSGNSVSKTNNTLVVTWSIDRKPAASRSFIDDDSGTTTSFIPDAPGEYLVLLVVQDDTLTGTATVTITATGSGSGNMGNDPKDPDPKPAPKEDPKDVGPAMADVAPVYRKLTGKDLTESTYKKVKEKTLRRTARSILKTTTAKVYLLNNELPTFGLTGASKPQTYYLKILAKPLNKDEGKLIDFAFVEMAISPYFNSKNSDAKSWTNALFESFLGRKPKGAEKSAAMKMWNSKEAKLFGQKGRGQADAAGILAKQPEFVKNFLKRSYKLYMGTDAEDETIEKAYAKYQESPEDFWKIIERWVVPKKS